MSKKRILICTGICLAGVLAMLCLRAKTDVADWSKYPLLVVSDTSFDADEIYTRLESKLPINENGKLTVEDDGRITYSNGKSLFEGEPFNFNLTDEEAVERAERELETLGLLPEDNYRAIVSRVSRTGMDLTGQGNSAETLIEFTVFFYRTFNGLNVLSTQEDGILTSFDQEGIIDLRYYWRDMTAVSAPEMDKEPITETQAKEIFLENRLEHDPEYNIEPVISKVYVQIDDVVRMAWVCADDNEYLNAIFIDMYTGEIMNIY